jgi:hypothetical protein
VAARLAEIERLTTMKKLKQNTTICPALILRSVTVSNDITI